MTLPDDDKAAVTQVLIDYYEAFNTPQAVERDHRTRRGRRWTPQD